MNDIKTILFNFTWDIFQFFCYHFGKKKECYSPYFKKEGKCFVNAFNKTVWFIPNDHSFQYGFDPELERSSTK